MKRGEFEHVVRAAAAIVDDEIVVIGSQAIHGEVDEPPETMLVSREVDMYPRSAPERAIEIDGAIGDGSQFDDLFGYYAHGVGPETPQAPAGWEGRLIRTAFPPRGRQPSAVAWCMTLSDLVLAKLAAGRPKDFEYVEEALRHGLVDVEQLRLGIELMPDAMRQVVRDRLESVLAQGDEP